MVRFDMETLLAGVRSAFAFVDLTAYPSDDEAEIQTLLNRDLH